MDQRGRDRGEGFFADLVPYAGEVIEVALDLGLGAAHAGGADDQAHGLGQLEVRDHVLQPLAIAGRADLAADPAAVRRVGHQHGVAPGKTQVSGQRRALVAALFLDDLDEQHLAALDHVLDLVAAAQCHALGAHFVDLLGAAAALAVGLVAALALTAATTATAATFLAAFLAGIARGFLAFIRVLFGVVVFGGFLVRCAVFDRGDIVLVGGVDFLDAVFGKIFGQRLAAFVGGVVFGTRRDAFIFLFGAQAFFFFGGFSLFGEQRVAIRLGDLVVIGVDFAEGEEPVAIAAEVDESRLKRRFDPGYLGKVDIALDLLVFGRFKVEFLNPVALQNRHPGFFRVARIDKHARCH